MDNYSDIVHHHCNVCNVECDLRCARCRNVFYCSADHQRSDWKEHKKVCRSVAGGGQQEPPPQQQQGRGAEGRNQRTFRHYQPKTLKQRGLANNPNKSAWANGLSELERYEWLTDCYRMRVDDECRWGGGILRGYYDPEKTNDSIVADFVLFCCLAVRNQVIPQPWNWEFFLNAAATLVGFAFEKNDAHEKYGGENVFHATHMGGRSLRYTGEAIFGTSVQSPEAHVEPLYYSLERPIMGALHRGVLFTPESAALFEEVGGLNVWMSHFRNKNLVR